MDIKTKVSTISSVKHEIELGRDEILNLLAKSGIAIPEQAYVTIIFSVPGGGDWSNTSIDISKQNPVTVAWTVETRGEHDA